MVASFGERGMVVAEVEKIDFLGAEDAVVEKGRWWWWWWRSEGGGEGASGGEKTEIPTPRALALTNPKMRNMVIAIFMVILMVMTFMMILMVMI